ncbi:MAG: response regulator transcription factor, partial [Dehalococcoidia bacterium]
MPPARARIVAVGEDRQAARTIVAVLQHQGHEVALAGPGAPSDLAEAALLLVDLDGARAEAVEVVRDVRRQAPSMAVVAIVGRGDAPGAVAALDAGADDYVFRPIDVLDLTVRVSAMLSRPPRRGDGVSAYQDPCLEMDLQRGRAAVLGRAEVALTDTEHRLLGALVQHAGRVVSHERLLGTVWGPRHEGATANLHVYVNQVRRKIEPDPGVPVYLETHRGIGYRFAPAVGGSLTA